MADNTGIEWSDATWNPLTGCTKVSPGCRHCYAETLALRLRAMGQARYRNGFALTLHPEALGQPLRWARPRRVFVNSMADLFHEDVPDGFISRVWDVMGRAHWHQYQVLTKRPERMAEWLTRWADVSEPDDLQLVRGPEATQACHPSGRGQLFAALLREMGEPPPGCAYPTFDWLEGQKWWPTVLPHVWCGTSVESAAQAGRIDSLRAAPAALRFLSLEPLLGPLPDLDLTGIAWVIVGAESGHGARPMADDWVREIRDQCQAAHVPFFFKQRADRSGHKLPLPLLDGQQWVQMP